MISFSLAKNSLTKRGIKNLELKPIYLAKKKKKSFIFV